MTLRTTEAQSAIPATLPKLLQRILGSARCCDSLGQFFLVESRASPRDVRVIDFVGHAEIAKRTQQPRFDAGNQVLAVHQVFLAQRQQVATVHSFRRRRQTEQESRRKVLNQSAIGAGGGVVKLVDDDVVKLFASKLAEMMHPTQRLNRGEEHVGVGRFLFARVEAQSGSGTNPAKRLHGLRQDFFPMSDEQHSTKVLACRIEGGQPRLSQAGRQDDQAGFVASFASRLERRECFLLDGVRRRRWFR